MSILIKGMEMPTSCGKCKLFDAGHAIGLFSPFGWCRVNGKEVFLVTEKADFCPLVPVPDHGRLGDLDKLALEMMDAKNADQALAMLDTAPTIIPAEEVDT